MNLGFKIIHVSSLRKDKLILKCLEYTKNSKEIFKKWHSYSIIYLN
jgi:hypothetical protein